MHCSKRGGTANQPVAVKMLYSIFKFDNSLLNGVKSSLPLNFSRSNKNYMFAFISNHLIYYPTSISLTYA